MAKQQHLRFGQLAFTALLFLFDLGMCDVAPTGSIPTASTTSIGSSIEAPLIDCGILDANPGTFKDSRTATYPTFVFAFTRKIGNIQLES